MDKKEIPNVQFFNTQYSNSEDNIPLSNYFQNLPKLGQYGLVDIRINVRERIKIVIGQNWSWLNEIITNYFKEPIKTLGMKQIHEFMQYLSEESNYISPIRSMMNFAPHKDLEKTKYLHLFYLEDIANNYKQKPLILSLVAQTLIEKFTKRESRIASFLINTNKKSYKQWIILLQSKKNKNEFIIFDPSFQFKELNNQIIYSNEEIIKINDNNYSLELLSYDIQIKSTRTGWNPETKELNIISGYGKELLFKVEGRTPAGNRFKKEDKLVWETPLDQEVPIEVSFHPFWLRLGHTTVRIGNSLYELTSTGWKRHSNGKDNPRAFIFNNPFFKTMYNKYKQRGMPPISLGCKFLISKKQCIELKEYLDSLVDAPENKQEKFSILMNNCNQGIMKVLEKAGIPGFTSKGYYGFSSILSFRRLLIMPEVKVTNLYIYPMPGTEIAPTLLKQWIPPVIYKHNSIVMELFRGWLIIYINAGKNHLSNIKNYIVSKLTKKDILDDDQELLRL